MGKIICVTNQKGGVGKTTTSIQLGRGLELLKNKKVLFVDMDPQCNMSYVLGIDGYDEKNILDLLTGSMPAEEVVHHINGVDIIPSSQSLSAVERYIIGDNREYKLKNALSRIKYAYDYIVIDSPPTLGITTVNILTASDYIVIPAMADVLSLQGIGQLFSTIDAVKEYCNPDIKISGILLTRYVNRLIHSREIKRMMDETADLLGTRVFETKIREGVPIRESIGQRQSIFEYSPRCAQAKDYTAFIEEFMETLER